MRHYRPGPKLSPMWPLPASLLPPSTASPWFSPSLPVATQSLPVSCQLISYDLPRASPPSRGPGGTGPPPRGFVLPLSPAKSWTPMFITSSCLPSPDSFGSQSRCGAEEGTTQPFFQYSLPAFPSCVHKSPESPSTGAPCSSFDAVRAPNFNTGHQALPCLRLLPAVDSTRIVLSKGSARVRPPSLIASGEHPRLLALTCAIRATFFYLDFATVGRPAP